MSNHLPMDHPLRNVYRWAGAFVGIVLVVFGVLAYLASRDDVTSYAGFDVVGLHANGIFGILCIVLGVLAVLGGLVGSNISSTLNLTVGLALIVLGSFALSVIRTNVNVFGLHVRTVVAMYILGLIAATFGLYGRVSGGRPKNADTTTKHPMAGMH